MSKLVSLFTLIVVATTFACSGPEKKDTVDQPVEAAEEWTSVQVFVIDVDMAAEENKKLGCKLWKAVNGPEGAKFGFAEAMSEAQCNWPHVDARVEMSKPYPAENSTAIIDVIAGVEFPASEQMQKRECASIFLTTNKREIVTFDCTVANREGAAAEKGWIPAYQPGASKSADEAAFRLYGLFGFIR